jgi:hypothetical protein
MLHFVDSVTLKGGGITKFSEGFKLNSLNFNDNHF